MKISHRHFFGLILIMAFSFLLVVGKFAPQTPCGFLKEFMGGNLTMNAVPNEPIKAFVNFCPTYVATCCSIQILEEFRQNASFELQYLIKEQIQSLGKFMSSSRGEFKNYFGLAWKYTRQYLDWFFRTTYGRFYTSNIKPFDEFFDRIDRKMLLRDEHKNEVNQSMEIEEEVKRLFVHILLTEFSLLNPLVKITNANQIECLKQQVKSIKPFGKFPSKIVKLIGRSSKIWDEFILNLLRIEQSILSIKQEIDRDFLSIIGDKCVDQATEMTRCQLCFVKSFYNKPCLNYCLNTFRRCFGVLSEINPQWNSLIDSLVKFCIRLKNVHNPFAVLLTIPALISDAIMHYQEKTQILSTRIILKCIQMDIHNRTRRDVEKFDGKIYEVLGDNVTNYSVFDYQSQFSIYGHKFRSESCDFIDKVKRTKQFWTFLPKTLCVQERVAALAGEECWAGLNKTIKSTRNHNKQRSHTAACINMTHAFKRVPFEKQRLLLLDVRNDIEEVLEDGLFKRITTLNSIEGHENSVDYYYDYIDDEKQNSGVLKRHSITKKLQLNVSKTVSPITLLIIFTLVLNIFFSNFYYPK